MSDVTLINVASYSHRRIPFEKKINYIFGHNGSGKSTIAKFLYHTERKSAEALSEFGNSQNNCGDVKFLVYGSNFIQDNFSEDYQNGIFTITEKQVGAEREIKALEAKEQRAKDKKNEALIKKQMYISEKPKKDKEIYDLIWSGRDLVNGSLSSIIAKTHPGSKQKYYHHIFRHKDVLPKFKTLDEVEEAYGLFMGNAHLEAPPENIGLIPYFSFNSEDLDLLNSPVISSDSSYLKLLIDRLNNNDWVYEGFSKYLENDINQCPFCQSPISKEDLTTELSKLFDAEFDGAIRKLNNIKILFEQKKSSLENDLGSIQNKLEGNTSPEIFAIVSYAIQDIKSLAIKCLESIAQKISSPAMVFNFAIDQFNKNINKINDIVVSVNNQYDEARAINKNYNERQQEFEKNVFCLIYKNYETKIALYNISVRKLDMVIESVDRAVSKYTKALTDYNILLIELKKHNTDLAKSIAIINSYMKQMGIESFSIQSHGTNHYKLVRPSGDNNGSKVFDSLSEGEKTIITFLYFLALCDSEPSKAETILVIDDPISSLSHDYIYEISNLIFHNLVKNAEFNKVVLLTHNLYFFHELLTLAPRDKSSKQFTRNYSLQRIYKDEESKTMIEAIAHDDLLNQYQSFWKVLRDIKEGKVSKVALPNTMRNILEYYFGFIHNQNHLKRSLEELEYQYKSVTEAGLNNKYSGAFFRYLNRESHSDATNIIFNSEINSDVYLALFKEIFDQTGHSEHYKAMIEEHEEVE